MKILEFKNNYVEILELKEKTTSLKFVWLVLKNNSLSFIYNIIYH